MKRIFLSMAGAIALTVGAAPSPLGVKDAKLVDAEGREVYLNGVSFGNLFVQEPYMWKVSGHSFGNTYSIRRSVGILCGSAWNADFWERFQDTWITEDDVKMAREMGFNAVRLPFLAETLMYAEEPGITWREDGFARVKRIVGWCRDAGLYVVLDMHGAPGGHTGTGIEASYDNSLRLFTDRDYWEKGVALWREIARRYRDEPTIAMYDLLNEPLSAGGGHEGQKEELVPKLAEFYRDCIAAIRAEGARQPVSVEGEMWSTSTAIFGASFDPAMVAHFHRYTFQPDSNSFADWEKVRERLKCPLILGEYGENTHQWDRDTAAFARERGVHLLFWCWKKFAGTNPSPLMVPVPEGWEKVQAYLKGDGLKPTYDEARRIFGQLLVNMRAKNCIRDDKVADAVIRGKVETPAPIARFGVMSDVHVAKPGDEAAFVKALRHFDAEKVDGVVLAGDMADTGRRSQLKIVADAWFSVFPDDRGSDGRHVERLFIYGNHDMDGHLWSELSKCDKDTIAREALGVGDNRKTAWEECFREPFAPIWLKRVKGIPFIGAHYKGRDKSTDIESFMKAHAGEVDKAKPFFYIQHTMARNTAFGPWAEGADDGAVARALSPYPAAVAFCGDTHYTLTDERSLWQGAFTVVNTASLKYSYLGYSMRENSHGGYNTFGFAGEDRVRKHCQAPLETGDGRQAMLMEVYPDRIVLKRREFVTDLPLGDDWTVPLPADPAKLSYAARAAKRVAPEFAANAKVAVTPVTGTIREAKEPCEMLEVSFPAAEPRRNCRVFEYEVTATLVEDDFDLVQAQRRVFAPDCYLPPGAAPRPGTCRFALKELPIKGHYRFSVRPVECFGRKGAPIVSEPVLISDPSEPKGKK